MLVDKNWLLRSNSRSFWICTWQSYFKRIFSLSVNSLICPFMPTVFCWLNRKLTCSRQISFKNTSSLYSNYFLNFKTVKLRTKVSPNPNSFLSSKTVYQSLSKSLSYFQPKIKRYRGISLIKSCSNLILRSLRHWRPKNCRNWSDKI